MPITTEVDLIDNEICNFEKNKGNNGDLGKQTEIMRESIELLGIQFEQEIEQYEKERNIWKKLEEKQQEIQTRIAEKSFRLELSLARGHIDIARLRKALSAVRSLENCHLSEESSLEELRQATTAVQAVATRQQGAELAAELESTIVSYNTVCRSLLGEHDIIPFVTDPSLSLISSDIGTRYESSLLLWQRFLEACAATRSWLDTTTDTVAEITASTGPVKQLLISTKVRGKFQLFHELFMVLRSKITSTYTILGLRFGFITLL